MKILKIILWILYFSSIILLVLSAKTFGPGFIQITTLGLITFNPAVLFLILFTISSIFHFILSKISGFGTIKTILFSFFGPLLHIVALLVISYTTLRINVTKTNSDYLKKQDDPVEIKKQQEIAIDLEKGPDSCKNQDSLNQLPQSWNIRKVELRDKNISTNKDTLYSFFILASDDTVPIANRYTMGALANTVDEIDNQPDDILVSYFPYKKWQIQDFLISREREQAPDTIFLGRPAHATYLKLPSYHEQFTDCAGCTQHESLLLSFDDCSSGPSIILIVGKNKQNIDQKLNKLETIIP